MDDVYSEMIVDHYKHPRNFGELDDATHTGRGANASCGDMVEMYVKVQAKDGIITNIAFRGIGCALSTAAASMLTERIKNQELSIENVLEMKHDDLQEMLGIEISPTRMKCVSLPLKTLQELLGGSKA